MATSNLVQTVMVPYQLVCWQKNQLDKGDEVEENTEEDRESRHIHQKESLVKLQQELQAKDKEFRERILEKIY